MDQINFFFFFSDETRFNIFMLFVGNNVHCVCDLTEKLKLSQPKISRHLALLRTLGLLQDRRQGQWVYYSINPNLPAWCLEVLNTLKNAELQPNVEIPFQQINIYCE